MDLTHTQISLRRSIWSYGKIQWLVGLLVRNRTFQRWDLSSEYLNVGCGSLQLDGFCNVDYMWAPGRVSWDITRTFPLPDRCLKGIYTEHCLEHIRYGQCEKTLREFQRLLKPGGIARIVVPDVELYCSLYSRAISGETVAFPYPEPDKTPAYYMNRIMHDHGHQFVYDFETMRGLLLSVGFRQVERARFREGRDPALLVDQEHRRVESLYVEAIA